MSATGPQSENSVDVKLSQALKIATAQMQNKAFFFSLSKVVIGMELT